jgi:Lar family restriction alleviation protein
VVSKMTEELKPCPFCGSSDIEIYEHPYECQPDLYSVDCDCGAGVELFKSRDLAIEAWNRRV